MGLLGSPGVCTKPLACAASPSALTLGEKRGYPTHTGLNLPTVSCALKGAVNVYQTLMYLQVTWDLIKELILLWGQGLRFCISNKLLGGPY